MNMVFHAPACSMTIGMGQAAGLAEVPEARFIRNMPAAFMSPIPEPAVLSAV